MDLSVEYLGLTLAHPLVPGASPLADELGTVRALEDAGAPAIVMRSLFEEQLTQEQLSTFMATEQHQMMSAEASSLLPEPASYRLGPDRYLEQLRKIRAAVKVPVIASLNGTTLGGWIDFARLIEQAGASALELNLYSVPTDPSRDGAAVEKDTLELVRTLKARVKLPVAVKLSPFYTSVSSMARGLEEAGADGLVLFNRLFEPEIDVDALEVKRVLHLSDSSELPLRLRWLAILSAQRKLPLAMSGGVHETVDVIRALMAGATVVQLVSTLLRNGPSRLLSLRVALERWLVEREYTSVRQLRGSMNLKACPDPSAYERANYIHLLHGWREQSGSV
ncbi:MAG TPA: dihydroorotate dehydrogenase-like protein [Myxococcaceae bacterium]|nr:dihydroorotate dehydrogenase-like protein [Myxococcaceae bacterium]